MFNLCLRKVDLLLVLLNVYAKKSICEESMIICIGLQSIVTLSCQLSVNIIKCIAHIAALEYYYLLDSAQKLILAKYLASYC